MLTEAQLNRLTATNVKQVNTTCTITLDVATALRPLPLGWLVGCRTKLETTALTRRGFNVAQGLDLALQSRSHSYRFMRVTKGDQVLAEASKANDDSMLPLIAGLKAGDASAVGALVARYFDRVMGAAARRRRKDRPLRVNGPEDVAASVFESLWRKSVQGKFAGANLSDRDEFWRLLRRMIARKSVDHIRRESAAMRGGGMLKGESAFLEKVGRHGDRRAASIDSVPCPTFTPDQSVEFSDRVQHLMEILKCDDLREVLSLRMSGYPVKEIAAKLCLSDRSIQRKLDLIRKAWAIELHRDS